MRTLDTLVKLGKQNFSIVIPSTIDYNLPASEEQIESVVNHVGTVLSTLYGGYSAHLAFGGWLSDKLGLIREDSLVMSAYCPVVDDTSVGALIDIAEYVKRTMRQEAVLIVVNGDAYLV